MKAQRHFYGERSINTWFDLKDAMRKKFRQNNHKVFLLQNRDNSDRDLEEGHFDKEFAEVQAGMDNIMSLLSQWKESSPNPNKACSNNIETPKKEELLEIEHAEIPMVEESLTKSMEIHEEEGAKSKDFVEEILIGEDDVSSQFEVVSFSQFNDITSNLYVISKFIQLYGVCLREEY